MQSTRRVQSPDMSGQRPNKFLDAAALEQWAETFQSAVLDEWKCIPTVEYLGFWRWLECTNPDLLDDFVAYWHGGKSEARSNPH